jgi:cobalamin biosynthesis protein CbiG
VLGVGCSSDAPADELDSLVEEALTLGGLDRAGVRLVASLDRKLAEPAVVALARRLGAEARGYTSQQLASVAVPTPSDVVRRAVGTPSVAEAGALLASGGELLVSKRSSAHCTVALARLRA